MKVEPQKEHRWLQKLVGEWTYEGDCDMGPGQPRSKFEGSERVRSLGDIWVMAEGRGEMPVGGAATTMATLGYDPRQERFVGTWIGSMMTYLWVYDGGSLDAAGKVLTLDAEGPSMAGDGTMAKYQDVIELKSDDHRVLTSRLLGDDGEWREFMTAHYRRKKTAPHDTATGGSAP
jgi:hypothetical protein